MPDFNISKEILPRYQDELFNHIHTLIIGDGNEVMAFLVNSIVFISNLCIYNVSCVVCMCVYAICVVSVCAIICVCATMCVCHLCVSSVHVCVSSLCVA